MEKIIRYCDALIESAWLMALLVTPLFFMVEAFRISEPIKTFVFRSIVWFELAVWIVKELLVIISLKINNNSKRPGTTRKNLFKIISDQPLFIYIAGFLMVFLLSTIFSISPVTSLMGSYTRQDGLLTLVTYLIFFVLFLFNLQSREQVNRIIIVLALVCFTVDGYAILQHFHLDPLSWPKFEANSRIVSTFGHPIFAAAFLSTSTFILLPHTLLSFKAYLKFLKDKSISQLINQNKQITENQNGMSVLIHAILFGLICLLNMVSIWFTVSRGPILGFIVGIACFTILILVENQMKKVLFTTIGIGILVFIFLLVLNIPSGPLSYLRDHPVVGPLGHLFDAETGSGQTRVLIWKGMAKLTGPHAPLEFPDQTHDKFNSIRWLFGYGPDTLLYTYESFYDPQSYILEAQNVIYDRAHNRFWDILGFYGLMGILTEYGFFLYLIFTSLKNIGYLILSRDKKLFCLLSTAGGVLGIILPLSVSRPEYIGISFHFGLLMGLVWIVIRAIFQAYDPRNSNNNFSTLMNIGLLAALISHYIELSTGILTINSSLLFWSISALLLLNDKFVSNESLIKTNQNHMVTNLENIRNIGINTTLLIMVLVTFGSRFILNIQNHTDTSIVLFEGLTLIQNPEPHTSYAILILLFLILISGSILLNTNNEEKSFNWKNIVISAGIAFLFSTLALTLRSNQLAGIYQSSFVNKDPLSLIQSWIHLSTTLYLALFFFVLILTILLSIPNTKPDTSNFVINKKSIQHSTKQSLFPLFLWITASYVLAFIFFYLIFSFNIIPIQSDILYEKAWVNNKNGNPKMATFIYDQLISLSPKEPDYQRFAYQIFFSRITNTTDNNEKENYYQAGIEHLKTTYELEPYFVYNTETLADFYRLGGQISNNPAEKNVRFYFADMYYAAAVKIKPSRVDYLLGWAGLCVDKKDITCVEDKIKSALKINDRDISIYQFAGDLYSDYSQSQKDLPGRKIYLEKALNAYQNKADILSKNNQNPLSAYLEITNTYLLLGQLELAASSFKQLVEISNKLPANLDWQSYYQISELSSRLNQPAFQLEFLQKAANLAPVDQKSILIDQIRLLKP